MTRSPAPAPVVALRKVTKRFQSVVALQDVTLEVSAGEVLALLGDNGAALILLLGLLAPLAWYYWAWNRVGRDPLKGVIIPRFKPPQGLAPAACRYVKDMTFNRYASISN